MFAWVVKSFLLPLAVGAIFATVLYPLMRRMRSRVPSAAMRATIVILGFIVAFIIPLAVIGVLGTDAALEAIRSFQNFGFEISKFSPSAALKWLGLGSLLESSASWLPASEEQIRSYAVRGLESAGLLITRALQGVIADLPGAAFANVVMLFAVFTFLVEGPSAVAFVRRNSFFSTEATDGILKTLAAVCQSTIVATLVTGAIQAAIVAFACVITGTPNALLIGLVSFIASFLPIVGTAPITISLAIWGFSQGSPYAGIVFLSSIAVVGVADNLARPWVMKGGGEMNPLVAFVAAFGGLDVMGFYGLFVGPVIAGLFFAVLPIVTKSYARSRSAG